MRSKLLNGIICLNTSSSTNDFSDKYGGISFLSNFLPNSVITPAIVSLKLVCLFIRSEILASGSASITRVFCFGNLEIKYFKKRIARVDFPTPPFPAKQIIFL